jgi:hypothetical protein
VPPAAARPTLSKTGDFRLFSRRALISYGDENAKRLNQAANNYSRIVGQYSKVPGKK